MGSFPHIAAFPTYLLHLQEKNPSREPENFRFNFAQSGGAAKNQAEEEAGQAAQGAVRAGVRGATGMQMPQPRPASTSDLVGTSRRGSTEAAYLEPIGDLLDLLEIY